MVFDVIAESDETECHKESEEEHNSCRNDNPLEAHIQPKVRHTDQQCMAQCTTNHCHKTILGHFLVVGKRLVNLTHEEEVDKRNSRVHVLSSEISHLIILAHDCVDLSDEQ